MNHYRFTDSAGRTYSKVLENDEEALRLMPSKGKVEIVKDDKFVQVRPDFDQTKDILGRLAYHLTERGTGLSHGVCHKKASGSWWYTPEVRNANRRDWRDVAARWLRRYVGGVWVKGGHHIGRPEGGIAIGEAPPHEGQFITALRVDGKKVILTLIR